MDAAGVRVSHARNGLAWYGAAVAALASTVAAKDLPSTCQDICDTLTATACMVSTVHDVVVGSAIDCTTARDVTVSGSGEIRVHDGMLSLRAKSITLTSGGKITADCPQAFVPTGFELIVADDFTMVAGGGAKLSARCDAAGGTVAVSAYDAITVAALGIDANGTGLDAPGGSIRLAAGGTVSLLADLSADATQGLASGGVISVHGDTVDVQGEIRARGYGTGSDERPGGDIEIAADSTVTITSGAGVNVGSSQGSAGHIGISAGTLADIRRPLKAQGTGGAIGEGGTIEIAANQVKVDTDLVVTGGRRGGRVEIDAETGGVIIGTAGSATIDATAGANERGGAIHVAARDGNATLGGSATLYVSGGSGAEGGRIDVEAVDVTTNSGTRLYANGAIPDRGGQIEITARGLMTLDGTMEANNQGSKTFIYTSQTPNISSSITGYELVLMPYI